MSRCPSCHRRLNVGRICPHDGGVAPAASSSFERSEAPPEVPGFKLGDRLGYGGFATVWAGQRRTDGAAVAVKIARTGGDLVKARFEREANALAHIGPPYVPALYEHGLLGDGRPFFAMERLREETLARSLGGLECLPDLQWVLEVSESILTGLEAVHRHGFVHRDLKPDNVFLVQSPVLARFIDFGIAKDTTDRVDRDLTRQGVIVGSSEYISPEQLRGEIDVDVRADIYAFGVILYELLTLRVPFAGDRSSVERGHLLLRPPRLSSFAGVPEPLERLCLSCLAKQPDRRPSSAAFVREELARLWNGDRRKGGREAKSVQPDAALLTDSRQPVVLLLVECPDLVSAVEPVVASRKGVVARQWGKRYLCAFSGALSKDPTRSAIAVAHTVVREYQARAVLHLAALKVRVRDGTPPLKVYGRAVERPDDWVPSGPWLGVVVTAAASQIIPSEHFQPESGDGFSRRRAAPIGHDTAPRAPTGCPDSRSFLVLRPESDGAASEAELIGRDEVLDEVRDSLRSCLTSSTPSLFTLIGDHGLGKTRLARAFIDLAARRDRTIRCCALRAEQQAGRGQAHSTARRLLEKLSALVSSDEKSGAEGDSSGTGSFQSYDSAAIDMQLLAQRLIDAARAGPFVLVLDDAHNADEVTLDAIEYATLDRDDTPLWVAVCAHPRLDQRCPQWGRRANRHHGATLTQLDEKQAMTLAAELLQPAEYTPAAALRRLARWTDGNPYLLGEVVRTLKREGVVRKRPETGTWYLATTELDRLPASPVGHWLAMRTVGALPQELASCARVCSVLGHTFTRDELEWVQDAAERAGTASTPIDAAVGLAELDREHGFLRRVGVTTWAFRQLALRDAIYQALRVEDRAPLHRYALEYWRSQAESDRSDAVLLAVARHASALRAGDEAITAYLQLADRATGEHRYVDAEEHYSAAVQLVSADDLVRQMHALRGRAKVRHRIQRSLNALDDLIAARRIAEERDDAAAQAELLLEESTILDWADDHVTAAQRVEQARPLVIKTGDPRLGVRYSMASGRCSWRQERVDDAVELLQEAVEKAVQLGDRETRVSALLLLAPALVFAEKLDESAARFDEVIAMCDEAGDRFHLATAYSNRSFLWSATGTSERVFEDLQRAVQLAREIGYPMLERAASHNLAEYLYWSGKMARSLALARRAKVLRDRFMSEPSIADEILLARIYAARGERLKACSCVHTALQQGGVGDFPIYRIMVETLALLLGQDSFTGDELQVAWDALVGEARANLPGEEQLEVLFFRHKSAALRGCQDECLRVLGEAEPILAKYPIWRANYDFLVPPDGQ
ncbi:MAG: protein kinase [Proteobacteria bacterium]|nr:protein kinase [Pseudomonadota bacterium]